jgi:hypothetical protein
LHRLLCPDTSSDLLIDWLRQIAVRSILSADSFWNMSPQGSGPLSPEQRRFRNRRACSTLQGLKRLARISFGHLTAYLKRAARVSGSFVLLQNARVSKYFRANFDNNKAKDPRSLMQKA